MHSWMIVHPIGNAWARLGLLVAERVLLTCTRVNWQKFEVGDEYPEPGVFRTLARVSALAQWALG